LFVAIVFVAVASATWMTLGAPKMYRSGITLRADAPGADEQVNGASPAAQEQSTLNELRTTRYFRNKVAQRAPLRAYLKRHTAEGWGPSAIAALLRGSGGSLDARIDGALGPKRVMAAVLGPHFLNITYDAPSPALARDTLQALVEEYLVERVALVDESLRVYAQQLQQASAAVSAAQEKLERYLRRHPGSGNSSTVKKLEAAERGAIYQRAEARKALQSALSASPEPTVRVIDAATLPTAPTTGHKQQLKAMVAGLFAGLLVSGLGVVALTKGPQFVGKSDAAAPDLDFASMSDDELARLIQDMDVDEEWAAANGPAPDDLLERRTSSGGHDGHDR
jgi:hypothetical protein